MFSIGHFLTPNSQILTQNTRRVCSKIDVDLLETTGWAAFPPQSSGEDASASKKPVAAAQPPKVKYPWNAFGGSFPNVASSHGVHKQPTASKSGDRMEEGDRAALDGKAEEVQPGHDATGGENPAEVATAGENPAEVVPENPEYSTFNFWRQPVMSLIDEES